MRVNEAIIELLTNEGIDTIFGIPGKQTLPLNESIGTREGIDFVVARHETAVSHQAWGYAETSGRMAATCVIPGPGDLNAMNGLKNALNDSTPLLHMAVETEPELRGGDAIHETPVDTYDNVVKENILVESPASTIAELRRAISIARTPPKGPVRIGIPKNFLKMEVEIAEPGEFSKGSIRGVPEEKIEAATEKLAEASRPAILAGGGVRAADASDALITVAEKLDAPVVTTYKGKGVIPEDRELSAGVLCGGASPEVMNTLGEADTVLAVGSDLDAVATRGFSVDLPGLVHVALHPNDIGVGYAPEIGIVADAAETLDALSDAIPRATHDHHDSDWGAARARAVREADRERLADLLGDEPPLTSPCVLSTVREVLPRETNVAVDAGGFRLWTLVSFDATGPRSYVNPGSWATMGTGLPAAIGAALANPAEPTVALTGDGGLMMCIHELHTAVDEGIPLTIIALNNSDYAIISEEAGRSYALGEGAYGWDETPINLVGVAEGMGMNATRAETPEAIREEVESALESDGPTLIEVPTDPREPQASVHMRD